VGGDAWEFVANRYVAPLLAVSCILGAAALAMITAGEAPVRRRGLVASGALVVASAIGLAFSNIVFDGDFTLDRYFGRTWALLGLVGMTVFVGMALLGIARMDRRSGRFIAAGGGVLAIVFAFSGIGVYQWLTDGGFAVKEDQRQTERGLLLREATAPGDVIAVSYAGAPIYYSQRAGIDLLGKSDDVVARSAPRGDFYPGHNKWDYSHSIEQLQPDVITEIARTGGPDDTSLVRDAYTPRCLANTPLVGQFLVADALASTAPWVDCAGALGLE
jgi:hypothetical protein